MQEISSLGAFPLESGESGFMEKMTPTGPGSLQNEAGEDCLGPGLQSTPHLS